MNTQSIEKKIPSSNDTGELLDVHSIFYTIQGEGPFVGQPAVFIRLAGCNLQCPLCDTNYTSQRREMNFPHILAKILSVSPWVLPGGEWLPLIVITGGEPLRQPIGELVQRLLEYGYRIQIETNGTLFRELPYGDITVVCSPKAGKISKKLAPHIDALKYVVNSDDFSLVDGLPNTALDHPAHPMLARPPAGFTGTVYIQPVDEDNLERNQKHLNVAIESAMNYGYTLCLQTHKIIGME